MMFKSLGITLLCQSIEPHSSDTHKVRLLIQYPSWIPFECWHEEKDNTDKSLN